MAEREAPVIERAALERLHRLGGRALVAGMIALFGENAPARVARATTAATAGDRTGVERATHSLKSMAANLGALHLSALAESIEIDAAAGRMEEMEARVATLAAALDAVLAALALEKGESP